MFQNNMPSSDGSFIKVETPKNLDIVSDLRFSKSQMSFLTSSWDNRVLLYDCSRGEPTQLIHEFKCEVPVLSLEYLRQNNAFAGSLDGHVYELDYENTKLVKKCKLGSNGLDSGINNLRAFNQVLVTSTFDKQFCVIDPRQQTPVFTRKMDKKLFKLDTTSNKIVFVMSERTIEVYDERNWNQPIQTRESGLKHQINDLKVFPDGEGFAISSLDGRVSIEYFSESPQIQDKKYAFKCHRKTDHLTNAEVVYPVNALLFNKQNNQLYTAGSDGGLNLWNWQQKKRLKSYPKFTIDSVPESISQLGISYDSRMLIVVTSDDSFKNARSSEYTAPTTTASNIYVKCL